jgi:hypothetical protein
MKSLIAADGLPGVADTLDNYHGLDARLWLRRS